jgi:hypothetical protein
LQEKAKKSTSKVIIDLGDYADTTKAEERELVMKKGPTLIVRALFVCEMLQER